MTQKQIPELRKSLFNSCTLQVFLSFFSFLLWTLRSALHHLWAAHAFTTTSSPRKTIQRNPNTFLFLLRHWRGSLSFPWVRQPSKYFISETHEKCWTSDVWKRGMMPSVSGRVLRYSLQKTSRLSRGVAGMFYWLTWKSMLWLSPSGSTLQGCWNVYLSLFVPKSHNFPPTCSDLPLVPAVRPQFFPLLFMAFVTRGKRVFVKITCIPVDCMRFATDVKQMFHDFLCRQFFFHKKRRLCFFVCTGNHIFYKFNLKLKRPDTQEISFDMATSASTHESSLLCN